MAKKYYSGKKVDKLKGDIILTYGGRNIGKSYYRKMEALKKAAESKGEDGFGYLRRRDKEIGTTAPVEYFANMSEYIMELTSGEFNRVSYQPRHGKELYFSSNLGEKITYSSYSIGRAFALFNEEQYKSLEFPYIGRTIFEEVFTRTGYLLDEPTRLLNLYSTIKREKEYCPIYMIANTVSKVNPYIQDWSLTNLTRQKQGTIEIYKLYQGVFDDNGNEKYYKIISEYCAESENDSVSDKISKAFGRQKAIATGEWEADVFETKKLREIKYSGNYNDIYNFVFAYNDFKFLCHLIYDRIYETPFIYVERKSTEIQTNTRIISNQYYHSNFYSKDFIPLCRGDEVSFDLIKRGKIIYADNLTGTEFNTCLGSFRK